jgi:heat-inducible transcriptional repressor
MMAGLNDRAQYLLNMLIEHYIRDGQPVGSKKLAADQQLALSSASIRNVLADLEYQGYLSSPHTSAGRVPTVQGYRLFVDNLLNLQSIPPHDLSKEVIEGQFSSKNQLVSPVQSASSLLSALTNYAGLVMLPRRRQSLLSKVEFLPLSDNRVLVILIFEEDEVQNQIIYTDKPYSISELQQASRFINEHYKNYTLEEMRQAVLAEMTKQQEIISKGMALLIKATDVKQQENQRDYILEGQNHLLQAAEEFDIDNLRTLFEAFTEKQKIMHLLDKSIDSEGVKIFIGSESGYAALESCSLVTSTYKVDQETVGVLGVIGPTRMNYRQVISIVDVTAKLLGKALSVKLE